MTRMERRRIQMAERKEKKKARLKALAGLRRKQFFLENMRLFFPYLESLPHHDRVDRFLCMLDINQLEGILVGLIKNFIRSKKFLNYLINKCVPIAIYGTQKHTYDFLWSEECLERTRNEKTRYYCYTLEASLVFQNGIIVPLIAEFLDFMQGDEFRNKQDCETKAFKRLAEKIKTYLPRLKIILLIDGIYCIKKGVKAFIKFMDETFRLFRLNLEWISQTVLRKIYQVRYV